jgi:branched-subunit amino acid aminotransferase/4-amino-4-deoxychorismate lyase
VGACRAVAGTADDDVHAFLDACLTALPPDGRWFPRVECTGEGRLSLRLRVAPPLAGPAVLWPFPGPDPRTAPRVKGPDLAALGEVREVARARGADEAVLCSADGVVLEGALSAIAWWRGERLCLPDPALPMLDSVTRRLVVRLAERTRTPIREERARLSDLDGLEVWILSALHGIRPVCGWVGVDVRAGAARRAGWWGRLLDGLAVPPRVVSPG